VLVRVELEELEDEEAGEEPLPPKYNIGCIRAKCDEEVHLCHKSVG